MWTLSSSEWACAAAARRTACTTLSSSRTPESPPWRSFRMCSPPLPTPRNNSWVFRTSNPLSSTFPPDLTKKRRRQVSRSPHRPSSGSPAVREIHDGSPQILSVPHSGGEIDLAADPGLEVADTFDGALDGIEAYF